MESSNLLLIVLLVIVAAATLVSSQEQGIQCYVCNSYFHPRCDQPQVAKEYLKTCTPQTAFPLEPPGLHGVGRVVAPAVPKDAKFTFCRKNVVTIPDQNNGNTSQKATTRTIRSCGYTEPSDTDSCKWAASSGIQLYMCQCNGNACNSAYKTIPAIASVLLVAVTAFSL